LGSFFLRDSNKKNIILLATSTGIAPIKAILEQVKANEMLFLDKTFWFFFGARYEKEIFWEPLNFENIKLNYTKALSREIETFNFFKGYVQDALLAANIDLLNAQVYACGSDNMIESAKTILLEKGLNKKDFFSDAFVETK
jgi:CDP-4-dehydro-6-deoxyglucose reductase